MKANSMNLPKRLERLWWAGFQTHKASLDPRNSNGIIALEEEAQADTLTAIEQDILELLPPKTYKSIPRSAAVEEIRNNTIEELRTKLHKYIRGQE